MMNLLLVAVGGAAGSVLRHLAGLAALRLAGVGFPWGTLLVNVAGSLLMGICWQLLAQRGPNAAQLLVMTGFLGGFTTFSAFSLETAQLWMRGEVLQCVGYVAASVALSLVAVTLGMWLARGLA